MFPGLDLYYSVYIDPGHALITVGEDLDYTWYI